MKRLLFPLLLITTVTTLKAQEQQGMYFSKNEYQPKPLPEFRETREKLPQPIYDEDTAYVSCYWKAWELAFGNIYAPGKENGFVSQYIDAAFNANIFLWDMSFITMFARYGSPYVPAISALDNFYAKQHADGEICREIVRETGREAFLALGAVPMFHPAVVLEDGDVVAGGLHPQDQRELVVHLDRCGSHVVLDSSPFRPSAEVIADLTRVRLGQSATQEGRHLFAFDRVDRGPRQPLVERPEHVRLVEDQIGGVLDRHQAPVHARAELSDHRTISACQLIELAVQGRHGDRPGQRLGTLPVVDGDEGVVAPPVADAVAVQLVSQEVVAVEGELEPEWCPGRHTEVAQAEHRVDEVEVVVEALPVLGLEEGLAGRLVVPGLEGRTRLHGRDDVDQSGMSSPPVQDLLDAVLLADVMVAEELDGQPVLRGECLGVAADLIAERFGEPGVVEDADLVLEEVARGGLSMADVRERPRDDDPIEARQDPGNLLGMSFDEVHHGRLGGWRRAFRSTPSVNPSVSASKTCLVPATPG